MITLFICFFISGTIFTIVSSSELKIDVNNMVERIGSVVLYTGNEEGTELGILRQNNEKLKITGEGDNFIINKNNDISDGEYSSILGGTGNKIFGGINSTIFGGIGNNIQSNLSIILGGSGNAIYNNSTGSVVAGRNNSVNSFSNRNLENSVVIGNDNKMNGSYSSVVGNNSEVGNGEYNETYNSVAMGSGATVVGNNSFLRVDGSEKINLFNDYVFVVFGENGMAVNESEPNNNAKFNVGGRFVIEAGISGNNIQCGSGYGTGIVKIEDRDDIEGQKCLCSCNGEGWKSMIGDGQCESICRGEKSDIFPECVTGGIKIVLSGGKRMYSGECIGGSAIEGSYYMQGDTIWWQCQGKNGNTTPCSYKAECTGYIPGLEEGSAVINNNLVPSLGSNDRRYKYSEDKSEVCTYSCKTGYALNASRICSEVCNQFNAGCNLGEKRNLNQPTYTNDYEYGCWYKDEMYICDANCNGDRIWNGTSCVDKTNICGTEKYTCSLGNVNNTGTDFENFIWDCVDERENIVGSCSKPKELVNRLVYYNYVRGGDGKQNVYFYMTGDDIPVDIKIKQDYQDYNGTSYEMIYVIKANHKTSNNGNFDRSVNLGNKGWYASTSRDYIIKGNELYVMVNDKVYVLRIVNYNGLCANSCSTAGQCIGGVTQRIDFHGQKIGDKYKFTWTCKIGNKEEACEVACDVDAGKCGGVGTIPNSKNCNPNSDSDCNIRGTGNISITDFYMDMNEEKIVGSRCGEKRHCVWSGSILGISCRESTEVCTQPGFKCKENYVLSGCSCIPVSSICLTTRDPGRCVNGMVATGYSKGEGKSNYSYYCEREGMERVLCEASCSSGKIWNGNKCEHVPELCGETHYNCINQSSLKSNQKDEFEKKYKRTCGLGNNTKDCSECYTGYIMSGNECKLKPAIDCEATEYKGYKVPYLTNGSGQNVEKNTRNQLCKSLVRCETGVVRGYGERCRDACVTGTNSNLGTCYSGLVVVQYNGNMGDSEYTYECMNNDGYVFDTCRSKCSTGEYRNQNERKCGNINPNLCGETHYDCINGSSQVYSRLIKTEMTGYTVYNYNWWCKLGNFQTGCNETLNVVHNCKGGETHSGYYIKNNMTHEQQLYVTKTVNGVSCTAIAVCESGTISIMGEDCTNACPGGIMDTPRCNFTGVNPTFKQSATWTSGYTYKCGESMCSANCSSGKVWNGYGCVNRVAACNNSNLTCNQGNKNQVQSGKWGSTWNCDDINNENLNESICYKCNDGYLWKSDENICEEKSCSATNRNGYSVQGLSGSTFVYVNKDIANGKCTVRAYCYTGNLTLMGETCTCNDGYYVSGNVCNNICGSNPLSTPCNGSYIATGLLRQIPSSNTWTNLRGHGYICYKNNEQPTSGRQCSCGNNAWWNGFRCAGISEDSLCSNGINQCNDSLLIESTGGNRGNVWKCGLQGQTSETCYKCNDGYEWNGSTKCELINECIGSVPSGNGYKKNNNSIPTMSSVKYYYSDDSSEPCTYSCNDGYEYIDGVCTDGVSICNNKCIRIDIFGDPYPWIEGTSYLKNTSVVYRPEAIKQVLPIRRRNGERIISDPFYWEPMAGDTLSTKVNETTFYYVAKGDKRYSIDVGSNKDVVASSEKLGNAYDAEGHKIDWDENLFNWIDATAYREGKQKITKLSVGETSLIPRGLNMCPVLWNGGVGSTFDVVNYSNFYYVCNGFRWCKISVSSQSAGYVVQSIEDVGPACMNDVNI